MLTNREKQIMELVSEGNSNDDIAEKLSITKSTVKKHLERIFKKLNAFNRVQATLRFMYEEYDEILNIYSKFSEDKKNLAIRIMKAI